MNLCRQTGNLSTSTRVPHSTDKITSLGYEMAGREDRKGSCFQAQRHEFNPQDPRGKRKEQSPTSCSLNFTQECDVHTRTHSCVCVCVSVWWVGSKARERRRKRGRGREKEKINVIFLKNHISNTGKTAIKTPSSSTCDIKRHSLQSTERQQIIKSIFVTTPYQLQLKCICQADKENTFFMFFVGCELTS